MRIETTEHEHSRGAEAASTGVRIVHEVADLALAFAPDVQIVVLRRTLDAELADEAERLSQEAGFRLLRRERTEDLARSGLTHALPAYPALARDLAYWAEVLGELVGAPEMGIRLACVDHAMCPRFHVDRVTFRTVCTYRGAGTEYVAHSQVDRRWLGLAAGSLRDEETGLLRSPHAVRAARPGDLVLLKGEAFPGNQGRGAVHRSPAASAAAPRLVLTLDGL
jgi:Protein of unknown function (DUF1826)